MEGGVSTEKGWGQDRGIMGGVSMEKGWGQYRGTRGVGSGQNDGEGSGHTQTRGA